MTSGPHGRLAGLRSLPSSAVRTLAAGIGFVAIVASLFAGVGAWQDRDTTSDVDVDVAAPEPAPAPAPVPAPSPAPAPAPDVAEDEDEDPEPDPEPATGPRPADVSVQLLNGIGADGSAAVERARTTLTEAGFRIAASRNARPYDVTTIFYTVGFEDEGRLVGSVLGVSEINAMTELPAERRLSDDVMVHVVLGSDRS